MFQGHGNDNVKINNAQRSENMAIIKFKVKFQSI